MCGIAGIYGKVAPEVRDHALTRMSVFLKHRGPDGRGLYADASISMAHTRLSIIDLSERGNQPLYNEDRSLVLICNGEIYNYKEVQNVLLKKGHTFSSNSDCEIILHLYEEYAGDFNKILPEINGMFAFALWDSRKRKLFLVRDRIGIKPLYYSFENKVLLFASEVAAIAEANIVQPVIDDTSLYEYFLLGYIPGPNSLYKEIKSLKAGHFLEVSDEGFFIREYWSIPQHQTTITSEDDLLIQAEELFFQIVKEHLVADVPVGTFLSAGVDSSLVTAMAAEHHPGIHSFTASFPGEPEDEGAIAVETARLLNTTHHSYDLAGNFFKDFNYHFQNIDQPFAITSALSLARISEMAQSQVKVVLSGDGADELFAGYARHKPYWQPPFLAIIPAKFQAAFVDMAARLTRRRSFVELRKQMKLTEGEKFLSRIQVITPALVSSLLSDATMKNVDTRRYIECLDKHFADRDDPDEINRMLYVDMKTTLVDEMLTKCDRMTMRHSIEGRVPFLDHRFVEFAFGIPSHLKIKNGVGKMLLRKMLDKRLGYDLAYRKKTGFNSPLSQWLKNDAETRNYANDQLKYINSEYFDKKFLSAWGTNLAEGNAHLIFYIISLGNFLKNEGFNSYTELSA